MSTFLGYEDGAVALGQSPSQMKDTIRGLFTTYGWQVVREQIPGVVLNSTSTSQDDDTSTLPTAISIGSSGWVGYCSDTAFTPTRMYLMAPHATATATPKNFVLEYSDDGSSWSSQQAWTDSNALIPGELLRFDISGASSHRWWRLRVTAAVSGSSFICPLWYLENASGWRTHPSIFIDLIPPSGQTIGNSTAREITRIYFSNSAITVTCLQELLTDIPYLTAFTSPGAGAVTLSVTMGGVTVSYTGSSGDSSTKNARKLYEALKESTDANFTAWTWHWVNGVIFAKRTAYAQCPGAITCSNITNTILAKSCPSGVQASGYNHVHTLSIDLANGFIYYLQVNERGFALATKINSGFSGPIHVCYADNLFATGAIPDTINDFLPPMTPIEVVYGKDSTGTAYSDSQASITHWFGHIGTFRGTTEPPDYSGYSYGSIDNRWTFAGHNIDPEDKCSGPAYTSELWGKSVPMAGEGFLVSLGNTTGLSVHRLVALPQTDTRQVSSGTAYAFCFFPGNNSEDWYRYTGTLVDEQLVLVPHPDAVATLTSTVLSTDTTISVDSTTNFPASGHVVIEGECIAYASKTSGAFSGCTRGAKGTVAAKHYSGEKAFVGGWFVKINQGLLFAGYEDPT